MGNKLFNTFRFFGGVLRGRKMTVLLVTANIFILTLFVTGWSSSKFRSLQQDNKKKVEKRHSALKDVPIEIIEPKVKGRAIALGEDFDGDSDWLSHLTFRIRNKSNKPVTFVQLDLDFPETIATGPIMMHRLLIGRRTDLSSTQSNATLHMEPNNEIEISLEPEFKSIKRLIEARQGPMDKINNVMIRIGDVMFEDGTIYSGGGIFKPNPDPTSSQKWILLTDEPRKPRGN